MSSSLQPKSCAGETSISTALPEHLPGMLQHILTSGGLKPPQTELLQSFTTSSSAEMVLLKIKLSPSSLSQHSSTNSPVFFAGRWQLRLAGPAGLNIPLLQISCQREQRKMRSQGWKGSVSPQEFSPLQAGTNEKPS